MKAGIIVFPGTNCDKDTFYACQEFGWDPQYIWHDSTQIPDIDVIFIPGGFSYGDYVRSGAIAKFSPIMVAIKNFIKQKRGLVVGICNGFQILCECGLLPGALTHNESLKFICQNIKLNSPFTPQASCLTLPIAHAEGRYVTDEKTIQNLKEKEMIFLTYQDNPNGSAENIAGLYDKEIGVIGMMPHPERAIFKETGIQDGKIIFEFIEKILKLNKK